MCGNDPSRFARLVSFRSWNGSQNPACASDENFLGLDHGTKLAQGDMTGKVIEAARARDECLFGGKPAMRANALNHLFRRLDVGSLHVNGAHPELLVAQIRLVMRRHVMLDEVAVARD